MFVLLLGIICSVFLGTAAINQSKHEFKAETSNLLNIIVNSLYSDREIFMRELISNSVDAMEKLRYLSLTDPKVLGEGDTPMEINITVNTQKKLIIVEDTGIGMNREEMITNLGIIAESGTSRFRQSKRTNLNSQDESLTNATSASSATSASGLIGMFGVGFFSSYLVADRVEFYSKRSHNPADNYAAPRVVKWSSDASSYYLVEDVDEAVEPDACPHRGSRVVLHLRENSEEFLDTDLLKHIILKYSGFVGFPINLEMVTKRREEYTPDIADEDNDAFDAPIIDKEGAQDTDTKKYDDIDGEKKPKSFQEAEKAVKKRYRDVETRTWVDITKETTSIWLRNPQTIKESEYIDFYMDTLYKPDPMLNFNGEVSKLAKDMAPPLTWIHFRGEGGEVDFRALIFVPGFPSLDYYEKYHDERAALSLYINRVFVTNETGSILPKWLQFVKGVVDSDSIRINLSREFIQESRLLKKVGERIARAMVKKLTDLYKETKEAEAEYNKYIDRLVDEGNTPTQEQLDNAPTKSANFYKIHHWYKRSFFMGAIEDKRSKDDLMRLLLFPTTRTMVNHPDVQQKFRNHQVSHEELPHFYTLQEYVESMPSYQSDIYIISCTFIDECLNSPYTEAANSRGLEVIFITDVNEDLLLTDYLTDYRAKSGKVYKIKNIVKLETKLPDKPADDSADGSDKDRNKDKIQPDTNIPNRTDDKLMSRYHLKLLRAYMRQATSTVHGVERSTKLPASTPALAASTKHSHTPLQEKAMQHSKNAGEADHHRKQRTLEVNFDHSLIKKFIAELVMLNPPVKPANSTDSNDDYVIPKPIASTPEMDERAVLLADIATYFAGYEIENKKSFSKALFMVLDNQLKDVKIPDTKDSRAKDEL